MIEYVRVPPLPSGSWQVGYHFQQLFPDLDAAFYLPDSPSNTAVVVMHPTVGFLNHYMLEPLSRRGLAAIGVNSRHAWNDSTLTIENVVVDLGSVVHYLKMARGYERVVLLGNSGGSFMTLYQNQAERPSIRSTPAGDPPDLTQLGLQSADALILVNATRGRARALTDWLDPAVVDERDPFLTDPELDIFSTTTRPPFGDEFLKTYRLAQEERNLRITRWVWAQLRLRSEEERYDAPFIVHRTSADPRFLDLELDPSDRDVGCLRGDPREANYAPTGLARMSTLRSWLSQWSLRDTNWDVEESLRGVSIPVMVIQGTRDLGVFPSDAMALYEAAPEGRRWINWVKNGLHYFENQPELIEETADLLAEWIREVL